MAKKKVRDLDLNDRRALIEPSNSILSQRQQCRFSLCIDLGYIINQLNQMRKYCVSCGQLMKNTFYTPSMGEGE